MKRLVAFIVSVFMVISVVPVAFATETETETVILYTNDIHCAIDNYPVLAAYRAELISQGKNVVVVDAGDAIQGEIIGSLTEGEAIADIMNAVGYDYAVPGNHEFDYGMEAFLGLAQNKAEYEYICSNFYNLTTVNPVLTPYAIKDFGDYQVAFIGISTPDTVTSSTPEYFKDENGNYVYGFPVYPGGMTDEILYENIQESVDNAIADGADIVVAVGHAGNLGSNEGWKSADIIANTDGIDYFIDGHSHETVESESFKNINNEDVILTSTGEKFANFGVMTISGENTDFELVNPDNVNVETMSEAAKTAYNTVKAKVDGYYDEIEYLYEEIGISEANLVVLDSEGNRIVRFQETNAGDFVADAYRAVTGADIAIVNGGGVRADVEIGSVSRKTFMDINSFNNDMCVIEVTGQQLIDVLEHGARRCPEPIGGFFQVSGLSFEIHTYRESPVICDNLDNFIMIDGTKERRVQNVCVGGEPVDLGKTYTLAGSTYVLTSDGDGLTMLKGSKVVQSDGLPCDSEMLIEYFTEHLNCVIPAEKYGNLDGDGRIKIFDVHVHNFNDSNECDCGAAKADYSEYDAAFERYTELFNEYSDVLAGIAKDYIRAEVQKIADEYLGGTGIKQNYSEDEQYILDGIADGFNEICDAIEEGVADGTFLKPDYTEIEAKIAEFEKTYTSEEHQAVIAEIKAELEAIKATNPETAADIAEKIAEIEAEIDSFMNCNHMCHKNGFVGFLWKIICFFSKLFGSNPVCKCGALHY